MVKKEQNFYQKLKKSETYPEPNKEAFQYAQ